MLLHFAPGAPREEYFEVLADAARRELEEVESAERTYPLTSGFLALLHRLARRISRKTINAFELNVCFSLHLHSLFTETHMSPVQTHCIA